MELVKRRGGLVEMSSWGVRPGLTLRLRGRSRLTARGLRATARSVNVLGQYAQLDSGALRRAGLGGRWKADCDGGWKGANSSYTRTHQATKVERPDSCPRRGQWHGRMI